MIVGLRNMYYQRILANHEVSDGADFFQYVQNDDVLKGISGR